jgi:hypothetical protein
VIKGGGGDGGVGGGGLFIFVRKQLCNVLNKKFDSCINLRIVEIIFLLNVFLDYYTFFLLHLSKKKNFFLLLSTKKNIFFTNLAKI